MNEATGTLRLGSGDNLHLIVGGEHYRIAEDGGDDEDPDLPVCRAINGDAGGQETKMTRNEAAALETVAAMGWSQFTIRQLQEALGLSYHQTYRILHGYASRGMTYLGLLEKCPAVSYVDATVLEDGEGYAVRRREHLFLFDRETYRRWARGGEVWIDEGDGRDDGSDPDDTCNFAAGLQQICSTCREDQKTRNGPETGSTSTDRETRLSLCTNLQQHTNPHSDPSPPVSGCAGGCDIRGAANDLAISPYRGDNQNLPSPLRPLSCSTFRELLQTAAKKKGPLQESLPGVQEPDRRRRHFSPGVLFGRYGRPPDRGETDAEVAAAIGPLHQEVEHALRTAVVLPVPGGPRRTVFKGEEPRMAGERAKARSFIRASR